MDKTTLQSSRRRHRITVAFSDTEYESVALIAKQTGFTRSAYLRAAALNRDLGLKAKEEFIRTLLELIRKLERMEGIQEHPELMALLRGAVAEAGQLEV